MALFNGRTYNLTVTYGQYLFDYAEDSSLLNPPELKWGWKATATIIDNITPLPDVPTGWFASTPPQGRFLRIETTAYSWDDIAAKIAVLNDFWDPSNT